MHSWYNRYLGSIEIDDLESPMSAVSSIFYHDSSNLNLTRIINCDLAINNLTTANMPEEIWKNLNRCCIEKFGNNDYIKVMLLFPI
jgi:hypothetical protein